MTGPEFRETLDYLGISGRRLAHDLGIAESTVYRWASGEVPVAPYIPYVLKLLRERREIAGLVEA